MTRRITRKRILIAIVSMAIILAAGIYTWQSLAAWKGYESRLAQEQSTLEALRDAALSGKDQKTRLSALRQLDDRLAKRDTLCDMNPLFSWQASIVPTLRDGVKRCNDKVRQLGVVAPPLHALRVYLDTSEKLQGILGKLTPTNPLTDTNWAKEGLDKAKKARSDIEKLQATGEAEDLKEASLTKTDALIRSWEALIGANEAKDKTRFISASAAVIAAYADFAAIADTADATIKKAVQSVTDAARAL